MDHLLRFAVSERVDKDRAEVVSEALGVGKPLRIGRPNRDPVVTPVAQNGFLSTLANFLLSISTY